MTCPNCPLCMCKEDWLSPVPTFQSTVAGIVLGIMVVLGLCFLLDWSLRPSPSSSPCRCESPDGGRP